jgi:hypothetical protein
MSYLPTIFGPAFGPTGRIAAGAKLFFYLTGTSTLSTVYADASLTTPLSNPVVADVVGRFPDIFIDDSIVYRIRMETAQGELIDEVDPYASSGGAPSPSFGDLLCTFDFIPESEHAAIVNGTSTYDCTADLNAFTSALASKKGVGLINGGTYYLATWEHTQSGYQLLCAPGVVFKQKPGLTGDSEDHPIIYFHGATDITFGDAKFIGNIATDVGEWSHAVALIGAKRITIGRLYATNLRGDVVYQNGRIGAECYGNFVQAISGTNVYRNLLSVVGGPMVVGSVIHDGPVGYRDVDLEPNAGGTYQPSSLSLSYFYGGTIQCASGDPDLINDNLSVDTAIFDLTMAAQATTPPFYAAPGAGSWAIQVQAIHNVTIGQMEVRNYDYPPILLADKWDHVRIDNLTFDNIGQTEAIFKCVVLQYGTAGDGLIEIGKATGTLNSKNKLFIRAQTGTLNFSLGSGDITGGIFGAQLRGNINQLNIDAGNATLAADGAIFNLFQGTISNMTVTNSVDSTLFRQSPGVVLANCSATVASLQNAGDSPYIIALNSALNGTPADGVNFATAGVLRVEGVRVVTNQQPAVPAATGGATIDTQARDAVNAINNALKIHGLLA